MTLKELYDKKINIMEYLRDNHNIDFNDKDIIKCSYDMQAGSYIKGYKNLSHVPVLVIIILYLMLVLGKLRRFMA